eukprot:TRINITY_DN2651_c0_g1_i1.p1 TRINITY_DN2651_c0_g1~~TRINITY_DN2651_c0_g1_i1.p1  ORF type:complete len:421 (+),score=146.84 TRINITY_DN2651_c0_g1_i1:79-1263(+)
MEQPEEEQPEEEQPEEEQPEKQPEEQPEEEAAEEEAEEEQPPEKQPPAEQPPEEQPPEQPPRPDPPKGPTPNEWPPKEHRPAEQAGAIDPEDTLEELLHPPATSTTARGDRVLPNFPVNEYDLRDDDADEDDDEQETKEGEATWVWQHEWAKRWQGKDGLCLRIRAGRGSLWGTMDMRQEKWQEDTDEPSNMLTLQATPRPASLAIRVHCHIQKHTEEAGIYALLDAHNWVKLTICGDKEDGVVNVIFAQQVDGEPFVKGKIQLSARHGWGTKALSGSPGGKNIIQPKQLPVSLRIGVCEGGEKAVGHFAVSNGAWQPVTRGRCWMEKEELFGQRERASLSAGDPRQGDVAYCTLPAAPDPEAAEGDAGGGWQWCLVACRFYQPEDEWVTFERI